MASKTIKSSQILVAAIDFGTTYSGYAFSFRDKPMDIQTPQTWYAGSSQLVSRKTPTCLLIQTRKKTLFGFEAENTYAELTAVKEYNVEESYFFQHFKMLLHENKNLTRSTIVHDINGNPMPALKVFSLSIGYFKNHLLETIRTRAEEVNLKEIHFVITVPAIWNDSAKQFMREAAVEAGIDNDRLTIALEPEAASIYCQNLPTDKLQSSGLFDVAKAGTEYMVVDLGGGTVDITVHRKEVDGSLSSLHEATGGPWGGNMVNQEFINFFAEIVGEEIMKKFRLEEKGDYFDLLRDFETKKRTISPEKDGSLFIRIPASLKEIYENQIERKFEDAVQKSRYRDFIKLLRDKLKVNIGVIAQMFKTSIDATINHVTILLDEPKMRNVGRILLVGGYSECPLILKAFRDRFGEKRIINPYQAGLAVIKGAIYFGHKPDVICSRVLTYTYGTGKSPKFRDGIDPEELKFKDGKGNIRCRNVFLAIANTGDSIKLGEKVSKRYRVFEETETSISLRVFSSSDQDPKYTNSCTKLGVITVDLPPYTGRERDILVDFVFGLTEFMVETTDGKTGEKIRKYFNLSE